jgi:hypothetical protein
MHVCVYMWGGWEAHFGALQYNEDSNVTQGLRLATAQTCVKTFLFLFPLTQATIWLQNGRHQVQNTNIWEVHTVTLWLFTCVMANQKAWMTDTHRMQPHVKNLVSK